MNTEIHYFSFNMKAAAPFFRKEKAWSDPVTLN